MREMTIEIPIHPVQPQLQQMVEAILAPAHPGTFEALSNQPLTSTLNQSRTIRLRRGEALG